MKSLMLFLQEVLKDLGTGCGTSTTRDLQTITRRFEHEGLSFLTITLTDFGKDFEKSLDQGFVSPSQFSGFHRAEGIPRFLGGFLGHVFDRGSGVLLEDPCIDCIRSVRQLTLMFGKIHLPCSPARERAAFQGFLETERSVRDNDKRIQKVDISAFHRLSRLLWADILCVVDQQVYNGEIIPKHGSGSVADRLRGNAKWEQSEWTERLDRIFPAGEYLLPNWRHWERLADVRFLDPGTERPVRVVSVPKTLKTPRIIAIEPTCMQYMQQGLMVAIRDAIDRSEFGRSLVSWKSSVPNQHLALQGSQFGALASLDLREASDRVSNQLIRVMLADHPFLSEGVDACRTRKADVPGLAKSIRLAKFASMGSALTFPFESMAFMTMVFVGIEKGIGHRLTKKDIQSFFGRVRVYGDDIIVPVDFVHEVIASLETFGAQVNTNKSFWTGKFRESCGKEYYAGEDVSLVRMRSVFPTHLTDGVAVLKTIDFRNRLYKHGLWNSASFLDGLLGRLNVPMPLVLETSPVKGRYSFLGYESNQGWDKSRQVPVVRGLYDASKSPSSLLDGIGALHKILSTSGDLPNPDDKHLRFAGRPSVVNTKLRIGTPY